MILPEGDIEINSLSHSDSEIDSFFDTDEILQGEDLEIDSFLLGLGDRLRLRPRRDPQGKDLEVDSLRYSDSEIDSEFDPDKVDSEETARPFTP